MGEVLRSLVEEQREEWDSLLTKALVTYNSTMHSQTGKTPSARLLEENHEKGIVAPIPLQEREKWVEGHPNFCPFRLGQLVLRKKVSNDKSAVRKLKAKYSGPYRVQKVNENGVTYQIGELEIENAAVQRVHHRHLKPWIQPPRYLRDYYALEVKAAQSSDLGDEGVSVASAETEESLDSDLEFSGIFNPPRLQYQGGYCVSDRVEERRGHSDPSNQNSFRFLGRVQEKGSYPFRGSVKRSGGYRTTRAVACSGDRLISDNVGRTVEFPNNSAGKAFRDLRRVVEELSKGVKDLFGSRVRQAVSFMWGDLFQELIVRGETSSDSILGSLCLVCRDQLVGRNTMKDVAVQTVTWDEGLFDEDLDISRILPEPHYRELDECNMEREADFAKESGSETSPGLRSVKESTRYEELDQPEMETVETGSGVLVNPTVDKVSVKPREFYRLAFKEIEGPEPEQEPEPEPELEDSRKREMLGCLGNLNQDWTMSEISLSGEEVEPESAREISARIVTRSRGRAMDLPNVQARTLEFKQGRARGRPRKNTL
jgi:hypothetical protein